MRVPTPPVIFVRGYGPNQLYPIQPIPTDSLGRRIMVSILGTLYSAAIRPDLAGSILAGDAVMRLREFGVPTRPSTTNMLRSNVPTSVSNDFEFDVPTVPPRPEGSHARFREEVELEVGYFENEKAKITFKILSSATPCVYLGRDFVNAVGFMTNDSIGGWRLNRDSSVFYAYDDKCLFCPIDLNNSHTLAAHFANFNPIQPQEAEEAE